MTGVTIYTTVPKREDAVRIARSLIEERLAACVNILGPGLSCYRWEGTICEDEEWVLFIKTTRRRVGAVERRFASLHPYSVPAFIVLPWEQVSEAYGRWTEAETSDTAPSTVT